MTMNTFGAAANYLPKKKDRVITLRVDQDSFDIVESFAKATEQEPCYSSYMGRNKFAYFTGCHLQNI